MRDRLRPYQLALIAIEPALSPPKNWSADDSQVPDELLFEAPSQWRNELPDSA